MTPKQERFCREYVIDLNGKQAATRAGYSAKTAEVQASRLLSNAKVADRVAELQGKTAKKLELSAEWVLERLTTVAERCMQARPVLDRKGAPVVVETPSGELAPAYTFDSGGANSSLGLIGKHLGMFVERHAGPDGGPMMVDVGVMTPVERAQRLAAIKAKLAVG